MDDAYNNLGNQKSKSKTTNMPIFIKKRGGLFRLIYLVLFIFLSILFIILIITRTIAINAYKVENSKLYKQQIKFINDTKVYKNHKDIIERSMEEHKFRISELKKDNTTLQSKLYDLREKNEELENKNYGIKNSIDGYKKVLNDNNERKKELNDKIDDMRESNKKVQKMIDELNDS